VNQRSQKSLHRWHRRAGVAAATVLVYLVASGLPLQYSSELQLGARYVPWAPVLNWYGLQAPDSVRSSGGLTAVGDAIFAREGFLFTLPGFKGAISVGGILVAAGQGELVLLQPETLELLERWPMPTPAQAIGTWQNTVVLKTGQTYLLANADLVNWRTETEPPPGVAWAPVTLLPSSQATPFRSLYRQRMLTLERVLQDLHSGRFFGWIGMVIVDAASLLLLFLAVSGLVMWARYSTSRSRR
jgi:uncharacterized iron-regulated membrane protein